jgi:hypothetical protein
VITALTVLLLATVGIAPASADVWWGPDSCVNGYVWREARSTDHVCVVPATRDQTWRDNAAAPSRWTNGPFGPHTCISGFVWREAFPGDDVCVTPEIRTQAANDNANAWRYVAAADEYHCALVPGLGNDAFCIKLDHDIFGNYNSIRTRYQHYSGTFNTIAVGVLWNTNRGASGTFPSRQLSGTSGWETHAWLTDASIGTCATAEAFVTSPPNDPNGNFFGVRVTVCRTR